MILVAGSTFSIEDTEAEKRPVSRNGGTSSAELPEEQIQLQPLHTHEVLKDPLSTSSVSSRINRAPQSKEITGLPGSACTSVEDLANATEDDVLTSLLKTNEPPEEEVSTTLEKDKNSTDPVTSMGQQQTKRSSRTIPKNIMNEDPQELMQRQRLIEAEVTGNCRPWSDHVYYKLFLDTEGRSATLMVLKCEITFVDVFTDVEHVLYRSRFIGGKSDGVAQLFVFDLMKVPWEEKIPKSQAIELNVDIVISSSPIYTCSETLLHLIKLEKSYLKHQNFDGQLNVTVRFAHALGWDAKDDDLRHRIHEGLRNLYREGVNLEVMSADVVLEEMRVDNVLISDEERVRLHIAARNAWTIPPMNFKRLAASKARRQKAKCEREYDDSASEEDFEALEDDDMYHVYLVEKLDQILTNRYTNSTLDLRNRRGEN